MEMKKYIEMGEKIAGKQTELAKVLGISESYLRVAKAGRNGLNDAVCIKLADFIKVDRLEVIAASNLVTEKDEGRRKIFESCFKKVSNGVAVSGLFISLSALLLEQLNAVQCILC